MQMLTQDVHWLSLLPTLTPDLQNCLLDDVGDGLARDPVEGPEAAHVHPDPLDLRECEAGQLEAVGEALGGDGLAHGHPVHQPLVRAAHLPVQPPPAASRE